MASSRKRKATRAVAKTTAEKPLAAAQAAVASKTEVKPVALEANQEEVKVEVATAEAVKPAVVKEEEKPAAAKPAEKPVESREEKKAEDTEKAPKKRGRKPGSVNKTTAKKKAAEKEVVQEVYIEYNQDQILTKELVERIQEEYKNEGHRISSIKSLRVYINLDERKAYYVINDKSEGKFVEF